MTCCFVYLIFTCLLILSYLQFYLYKKMLACTIKTVSLDQITTALYNFGRSGQIFNIDDVVDHLLRQDYEIDSPPRDFWDYEQEDLHSESDEEGPRKTDRKRKRSADQEEEEGIETQNEMDRESERKYYEQRKIERDETKKLWLAQFRENEREIEQERDRDLLTFQMREKERQKARHEDMQNMMKREMFRQGEKKKDRKILCSFNNWT